MSRLARKRVARMIRGMAYLIAIAVMVGYLLGQCGCTPASTVAMRDGFDRQWRGYQMLQGAPAQAQVDLRVKVIVGDLPAPYAGTYSHPQGVIRVPGKVVKGKIVVPVGVLGHECAHALYFQGDGFANPDE